MCREGKRALSELRAKGKGEGIASLGQRRALSALPACLPHLFTTPPPFSYSRVLLKANTNK